MLALDTFDRRATAPAGPLELGSELATAIDPDGANRKRHPALPHTAKTSRNATQKRAWRSELEPIAAGV